MDEPKLTAQQRFDLLDMTRIKAYIQEAFADVISDILGAAHHNEAATGFLQKKPLMVKNFNITKVGSPSLQMKVERTWVGGADGTYSAHVYDQNGSRITGPNSPAFRNITVAAAPGATTRYLMVRRVATDDTSEARKFYTSSGGHTTTNVNTRTIDDYELQDSTTSADSDATLSSAGWIDIATFQTNGTTDINSGPTALAPSIERALLTWASAPPAADQTLVTVFENIQALVQLMKQIRYGEGSGRTWTDEILNDASFDEEGGIRWGKGDTLGTGKSAVYTRAQGASEIVTDSNATAAAEADLSYHMSKGVYASEVDPANNKGFMYVNAFGSITPKEVTKYYDVSTIDMEPNPLTGLTHKSPIEIFDSPSGTPKQWYPSNTTGTNRTWNIYIANASGNTNILQAPVHILQGAKVMKIELYVTVGGTGFDSNDYMVFEAKTQRLNKVSRTVTTQKTATFNYSSGGNWASGGNVTAVVFDAISGGDTAFIIDNGSYGYYLTQRITVSTAPGIHSQALEIFGGTVTYYIREASHAY